MSKRLRATLDWPFHFNARLLNTTDANIVIEALLSAFKTSLRGHDAINVTNTTDYDFLHKKLNTLGYLVGFNNVVEKLERYPHFHNFACIIIITPVHEKEMLLTQHLPLLCQVAGNIPYVCFRWTEQLQPYLRPNLLDSAIALYEKNTPTTNATAFKCLYERITSLAKPQEIPFAYSTTGQSCSSSTQHQLYPVKIKPVESSMENRKVGRLCRSERHKKRKQYRQEKRKLKA